LWDAERKAGEMLEKMPKHPPGPDKQDRSQDVTDLSPSYEQLGIRKQYAARWQAEASVPEQRSHAYLARARFFPAADASQGAANPARL